VCQCVWSIRCDIAIIANGQVNEPLLTNIGVSCMTESVEIFKHIFVLSNYGGHFTLKCDILLAKCVGVGTRNMILSDYRVIYNGIKSVTDIKMSDGGFVG